MHQLNSWRDMTNSSYEYDVFLAHGTEDREQVAGIATFLRGNGIRVWFEAWALSDSSAIKHQVQLGLDQSRCLLLCASEHTFHSAWQQIEQAVPQFRDPSDKDRRFVVAKLTPVSLPIDLVSVAQLDLFGGNKQTALAKFLETFRGTPSQEVAEIAEAPRMAPSKTFATEVVLGARAIDFDGQEAIFFGGDDGTVKTSHVDLRFKKSNILGRHLGPVACLTVDPSNGLVLSGGYDKTVRLWKQGVGPELVLQGHTKSVKAVAFFDAQTAISCSDDGSTRTWDLSSGQMKQTFRRHVGAVLTVCSRTKDQRLFTGGQDTTISVWDIAGNRCERVLEGHTGPIRCLSMHSSSEYLLSGSDDGTIRNWDVQSGFCNRVFTGHTDSVLSVSVHSSGRFFISSSGDMTIRLWEISTGRCLAVLTGSLGELRRAAWTSEKWCTSADQFGIKAWDVEKFLAREASIEAEHDAAAAASEEEHVQYTNAKVLLVGESGAGKTGLSKRLANDSWEVSDSTVGAWATQWKLDVQTEGKDEREIWLWDFGGQADQRLIHQLYMDEAALVALVFDGQKPDLFDALTQWDRDLSKGVDKTPVKILVAGRADAGGLRASRKDIDSFVTEKRYARYISTSAKTGLGCEELRELIVESIRWEEIPWRTSPLLFKQLKEEIIKLKDEGRNLIRFNELRDWLKIRLTPPASDFTEDQLHAVLGLLGGPCVVWELKFGSLILLQPERINQYAQAVIQTLREDQNELGSLQEDRVLKGELIYHAQERLPRDEETFVLLAMHQLLVEKGLCLRQHTEKGTLLIFPSYYKRHRPALTGHPAILVSYTYNGFLDEIYATLVVRLHHTQPFRHGQLWHYAADFQSTSGKQLGFKQTTQQDGSGQLEIYCDPNTPLGEKILFTRYVHEHLHAKASDVDRRRHYVCKCGTIVANNDVVKRRLEEGKEDILCAYCEERVLLWDDVEKMFVSEKTTELVRKLEEQSDAELDNESKERVLVGEVMSTVAIAKQISREKSVSDKGIDMEIEFKDKSGLATGALVFLQLKSGDSHLRKRPTDGAELFQIEARHAEYWMNQIAPVMLVVRSSEGTIRWMDVREYLLDQAKKGHTAVKHIVFTGRPFNVSSILKLRDQMLKKKQ